MRRIIGGVTASIVMIVSLSVAASAAGPLGSWARTNLRDAEGANLQDAVIRGTAVAVAWREPHSGLWLRTSTDAGDDFATRELIERRARKAQADICDGRVHLAYQRRAGATWHIDTASRALVGRGSHERPVHSASERASHADVACAGDRLFVGWTQRVDGAERIMVKHSFAGAAFPPGEGTDLGRSPRRGSSGAALTGVKDRAYLVAAFRGRPGHAPPIRFHRWSVGPGALAPVTYLGSTRIAKRGHSPVIEAHGDNVVVAWAGDGSLKTRVSHDRGKTWGPKRTVQGPIDDAGYLPLSIALEGDRIVLTHALRGCSFEPPFECSSIEYLVSTRDDFATWKERRLSRDADDLIVDFVTVAGERRLAAVLDKGSRISFLRKD